MSPTEQRMAATLRRTGIPAREIRVYGSQIMITCRSAASAEKWAGVLARFATVRAAARESSAETAESRPNARRYVKVWLTWATV